MPSALRLKILKFITVSLRFLFNYYLGSTQSYHDDRGLRIARPHARQREYALARSHARPYTHARPIARARSCAPARELIKYASLAYFVVLFHETHVLGDDLLETFKYSRVEAKLFTESVTFIAFTQGHSRPTPE